MEDKYPFVPNLRRMINFPNNSIILDSSTSEREREIKIWI
jgi:hypothetical protein